MLREVYEELGISLKEEEIENRQLFIKKENMDITRCFIFVVKKNNIYDFKNQTSCNE
jgi:8-oxo-dGTP pyrophosphatase MutT (NUDIX family)